MKHPTVPRALMLAAAGCNLTAGAIVYTPVLDVVVLVLMGPGLLCAAAALAWPRRWLERLAVGLVALPAALVVLLFGEFRWLLDPFRGPFLDYVSIVLLSGTLLLAGAYAAASVPRMRLPPAHARAFAIGVALVAVGAMGATGAALRSAPAPDLAYDLEPEARVEVRIVDERFEPATIAVAPGVLTEIVLVNEDDVMHTLSYTRDGETRHHRVLPLDTSRVLVRLDAPTRLEAWCEPHPWMRATLAVEIAGADGAAPAGQWASNKS